MKEIVCIGGSAGSLSLTMAILDILPGTFDFSVIIVLHRLKNVTSEMTRILSSRNKNLQVREPEDKELLKKGRAYLAPQNYHLQIEEDRTFSLDYSEPVNFSRPSIDVTFDSVASVYKEGAVGILLSGANADGAYGISRIIEKGGVGIVQAPSTAEYPVMPEAAIHMNNKVSIQDPGTIINYIKTLSTIR